MKRKRHKRGITPWKKSVLRLCFLLLLTAAGLHAFRYIKAAGFEDQREAARWGGELRCAQVSAFLPARSAMKEDEIGELEYKINTALAQDSIKLTAEGPDARLWQDCFSGMGTLTLRAGGKTVDVEAVGTGGAFFTFHPVKISGGSYYSSDSLMKDEILLDEETAWKLFGAFDVEGRTVQVEDMNLTIAGVYHNPRGKLYDAAGLPEYAVFVQYKTLLQFGGGDAGMENGGTGDGTGGGTAGGASASRGATVPGTAVALRGTAIPGTATAFRSIGSAAGVTAFHAAAAASEGSVELDTTDGSAGGSAGTDGAGASDSESTEIGGDTGSGSASGDGTGSSAGDGTGSSAGDGTESSPSGSSDETSNKDAQNMDNVGTGNTAYKDTGKITIFEIVMPDPVEGYAAAVVKTALGEDSGAVVVDNTNRFTERSLIGDLGEFALLGMRTQPVRYPYWENVAMGWETIFAALFLAECLLIILTVILLIILLVHWYRHRGWTVASSLRSVGDSLYEKQSRRRYPEYYEGRGDEFVEEQSEQDKTGKNGSIGRSDRAGLLEDKGAIPFERIREERKAVKVEKQEYEQEKHERMETDGPKS